MRALRWIIPLMVTALILSGVGLVSAEEHNTISGTIFGKVTDNQTDAPIPGALVQVDGTDLSAYTDADGDYEIMDVPAGQYSVSASADGYEGEIEDGVEVSDSEATSVDFNLQPMAPEEETDAGKQPGDRKGYVGTFSLGDGVFTITSKKEEVVIRIPEEGLEPITRTPGRAADGANGQGRVAGTLVDGAAVAVLVEFILDEGNIVPEARKIVVKPTPQLPLFGTVFSGDTNEEGFRILTIMRPDGTTKEVRLGRGVDSPENGDLVTVFPTRGRGDRGTEDGDKGGPPTAKGVVRAEQVRLRLEGFLQDLTAGDGNLSPQAAERLARRVDRMAEILEKHADKHVNILQKLSRKNLPAKAAEGMRKALANAQRGRSQAKANVAAARAKAGPPAGRGRGSGQVQPGGQPPEKGKGPGQVQPDGQPPENGKGPGQVQPGGQPAEKGKGQAGGQDNGKGRSGR